MRDARTLRAPGLGLRRLLLFGAVAATTGVGAALMLDIVRAAGVSPLEGLILLLFVPTFGWIALAFWNAVAGFVLGVLGRDPLSLRRHRPAARAARAGETPLSTRTALVMPVYDEDPRRTLAGLEATLRSLAATGEARHFHVFLLSDSTDPEVIRAEETGWKALVERWEGEAPDRRPGSFRYRRRTERTGRKAGNLADFGARWGHEVDFMVVLDADSVMSGPTLVELARTLEANPDAGLLQTVPIPARQETLFGRLIQLAAAVYSPMLAAGQAFWQGDAANYWGHNAILRVDAFLEHARLPVLPGRPPLGGEVLSHDFVEAALLRRAGWGVWLLPHLRGSHEDVPGNVLDYATRDRRWCQGSLQHLRLLTEPGLHPLSRLHFLLGAMGYVSSLLWLLLLAAGTAYVAADVTGADLVLTRPTGLATEWRLPRLPSAVSLLAVTAVVLFLPKALGILLALGRRRREFGGTLRLLGGALAEGVFSVVVAPVMMMFHARFVLSVVGGRTVPWVPQSRTGRRVTWGEALRGTGWIAACGVGWTGLTVALSPAFLLWMTPIFLGLVLAPALVRWTSRPAGSDRPGVPVLLQVPYGLASPPPPPRVPLARTLRDAGAGHPPTPPRPPAGRMRHRRPGAGSSRG